jgi:hypothetical protein
MIEILTVQVLTGVIGTSSIATADWLYHRGRIPQRLHSLWVAVSSTAICLPILNWVIVVFLGDGMVSWILVASVLSSMFLWQYYNLVKIPSAQRIRRAPLPIPSAERSVPPPSNVSR